MNENKKQKVEIKYATFLEIMRSFLGDIILKEALKTGEITVVDDSSGAEIGRITFQNIGKLINNERKS
jgi:hypothetical protein